MRKLRRFAVRQAASAGLVAVTLLGGLGNSHAITIELKDVAPDRIERQRAAADGRIPLSRTPDVDRLAERLQEAGVKPGAPMLMRIFKETSELEVWLEKGDRFHLFATYPICHWSGTLGPKLREGDKQTPEGFYAINSRQLRHIGRWPRAINLGYPNTFDRAHNRDGSYILMHGGCSSVGCFAMTNPVMSEIHGLAKAAIGDGQRYIPVHVFPFRMTDAALSARADSPWHDFWATLKEGYASFERTKRPPRVSVCKGEYRVEDALPKSAAAAEEPQAKRGRRGRARGELMLGALRTHCPEPLVVTADGKEHTTSATTDRTPVDGQTVTQR
ncbi:L,D-transpeptidase family protein [Hyphomicrobium sp. CS1GBMeth3]|uniref:L,D-transpeptidase family protein n=1 Tax=Hyphomicrobium sp. CS1GBMeth3 TaxID=1892845 RepID=UPI0009FB3466|nr:L,D-transpeptidase family protein [Hyphomicrobium sp. CS1GBMeth3]